MKGTHWKANIIDEKNIANELCLKTSNDLESRQEESSINSLDIILAIRVYHHIESFTSAMWRQSHQHGFQFGSHLSTDCTCNLLVCW